MGGRGMTVVFVPDLGGELVKGLAGHIAIVRLEAVEPDKKLVAFVLRKRQDGPLSIRRDSSQVRYCVRTTLISSIANVPAFQAWIRFLCLVSWACARRLAPAQA